MAHELEIVNGVAQMAYVAKNGTPWHGLGVPVEDCLTPEQMLVACGADWNVVKRPSYCEFNGEFLETGQYAVVRDRDGRVLTNVGADWQPVQNADAFEFFTEFVTAGSMKMETAGVLKDGQIVWALAKTGEEFTVFGHDTVESYLHFTNFHQFGNSTDVRFTGVRVVCNNTLQMSLGRKAENMTRFSHRRQWDPETVKETLGIASNKLMTYKEMVEFLGSKRYTNDSLKQFVMTVFPKAGEDAANDLSKNAQLALDNMSTQPGAQFGEGTFWQAANVVTYLVDHKLGRTQNNRLTSAWYGAGSRLKSAAMNVALDLAKAA